MMWTTLALAAAVGMAPAQAGDLTLSHVRSTHGVLGPTRAEDKLLPGDSLVVCFDIGGMVADDSGKVSYSMGLEVTDGDGKSLFTQEPANLEATASLGGDTVPAFARIDVGLSQSPGEHTLKVNVLDRATGRKAALTRKFTVLPKGFGLVRLALTADVGGDIPLPVLGSGGTAFVQFGAVGFGRDKDSKQPNLRFSVRVLDDKGKPTVAKDRTSEVTKDVPASFLAVPMSFPVTLNRPGKFTVELTATDGTTRETAKLTFPIKVLTAD
ncbi:MAG TPA: hypothetical protein VFE78_17545 [Gemmataceae bacterium]|nr:hypothetical protein [Gemmataceae bacterium]